MTSPSQASAMAGDPLANLDFCTLLDSAARLRPGRSAIMARDVDTRDPLSFLRLAEQAGAMAKAWDELGFAAGERVLVVADGSAAALVALFGALRAGLDVALAGAHLNEDELADFAQANGVAAIAGSPIVETEDISNALMTAAAKAERVRMIVALGQTPLDGAVQIDPLRLAPRDGAAMSPQARHARIITRDRHGASWVHRQRTLVAAALDFVTRTQIGTQLPLVSTILPASFAGLALGPVAALVAGAPLALHAPFDAEALTALLDAVRPSHLITPAPLARQICNAGLLGADLIATLVLLSRVDRLEVEFACEPEAGRLATATPVVDAYAVAELAVIAEPRLADGQRVEPLTTQHLLNLDGRDVVAARRRLHYLSKDGTSDQAVAIEGAAVSHNQ